MRIFTILLILTCTAQITLAQKIKASISSSFTNRIYFDRHGITDVIGDDSQYQIVTDRKATNLFLVPKIPVGKTIELSIINAIGEVADLVLQIKDIEGQVITISNELPSSHKQQESQAIIQMLQSMMQGYEEGYYVTNVKRTFNNHGLKIKQDKVYRFGTLIGARLVTINKSGRKPHELQELDFGQLFKSVIAVSLEKKTLPPRGKGLVWIIAKEEQS